jgi:hypothetical protein
MNKLVILQTLAQNILIACGGPQTRESMHPRQGHAAFMQFAQAKNHIGQHLQQRAKSPYS